MLWEEDNNATTFIVWWWKRCSSSKTTERICIMLVSCYPGLLPKYFTTNQCGSCTPWRQDEAMSHCVGQVQHPRLGYLSSFWVAEKHEGRLTVQTTCHQSIFVDTCFLNWAEWGSFCPLMHWVIITSSLSSLRHGERVAALRSNDAGVTPPYGVYVANPVST